MEQIKALLKTAKFSDFFNNKVANTFEFYFIAPKELLDEYGFDVSDETVSSSIKIEVSKDFKECSVSLSPTEYLDNVLTDADWRDISLELELIEVLIDVACQMRKLNTNEEMIEETFNSFEEKQKEIRERKIAIGKVVMMRYASLNPESHETILKSLKNEEECFEVGDEIVSYMLGLTKDNFQKKSVYELLGIE